MSAVKPEKVRVTPKPRAEGNGTTCRDKQRLHPTDAHAVTTHLWAQNLALGALCDFDLL